MEWGRSGRERVALRRGAAVLVLVQTRGFSAAPCPGPQVAAGQSPGVWVCGICIHWPARELLPSRCLPSPPRSVENLAVSAMQTCDFKALLVPFRREETSPGR